MKHNFKNRPKPIAKICEEKPWIIEEWFKGFEKELREKLLQYCFLCVVSDPSSDEPIELIKEILGE